MATNVYVDGFNLYYGSLKDRPYRWLDLDALSRVLLPRDQINRIRYFTARVSDRPYNVGQAARQDIYLRALRTIGHVSIHEGQFQTKPKSMALASPPYRVVRVLKTEEKGSDVNLASFVLLDAFKKDCDTAVVISNDSDLAEPVRLAQDEFGITVGVVNPHPAKRRSRKLQASFFRQLRNGALKRSQFPATLTDANGSITKPPSW